LSASGRHAFDARLVICLPLLDMYFLRINPFVAAPAVSVGRETVMRR
jgi:hypothetical protein